MQLEQDYEYSQVANILLNVGMTSFYDIYKNEFGRYGSLSGNDYDGDNYTQNSKEKPEDLDLEDLN